MAFTIKRLDHVQLAMPPGGETQAEAFYCGVLGFEVLPKPPSMAARGGRWFARNGVQIHVGAEADFRPARKAHPAIALTGLDALAAVLSGAGIAIRWDSEIPGTRRCFVDAPFGNRIELVEEA